MTFSEIIQRRSDKPHYPLWNIKVTDEEYEQLKKELCDTYNRTASFDTVQDEAMLYMAEWYRREYDCERPSDDVIFKSLRCNSNNYVAGGKALYKAALERAKWINNQAQKKVIQFVAGETNMEWFYSLLYQGGLPLKKNVNNYNGVWRRTIESMVRRGLDFEETELRGTAAKSSSIRCFCDRVVMAVLGRQYLNMPFYCYDEDDEVYLFLTKEIMDARNRIARKRIAENPFDIQWKFIIDEPAKRIAINFAIDTLQRLQKDFIEKHQLDDTVSFRIQVGDKILPGPEYRNLRSFYPFHFERPYNEGEEITVLAAANEKVICTDSLDLSEPRVIHQESGDGCYQLGYGRGSEDVRILFTEDWECTTDHSVITYHYLDNRRLNVVSIGKDRVELRNRNTNETKSFSTSSPRLFWTEFENKEQNNQYIRTPLFQINTMRFYRCVDGTDGTERQPIHNNISFWNPQTQTWDNNPVIGKTKARVTDGKGGYATPKVFLNTGTPINIRIVDCTESRCSIRFDWESGTITVKPNKDQYQGRRVQNGDRIFWTFEKEKLLSDEINCICTPKGACKQAFSIKVHIPFKGFYIFDSNGCQVKSGSLIPYSDFNVYRYSLNDEDVTVNIEGTNIHVQNNTSGYLKDVLERDDRISIRSLLDKNAQSVDWAKVTLSVVRSGRTREEYVIKEYPYHFKRIDNSIFVRENKKYMGDIWIIPFDRNQQYIVLHNEAGQYTLPENLQKLGKVLLISPQQRVFPKLEDLSEATGLSNEQRVRIKDEVRNRISEELKIAKIDSDIWQRCLYWYNIWYNNNDESVILPWNNVFEYKYIAKNANSLIELVLMLWLNCDDDSERDNLMNNLLDHERDLALQWFWLPQFSFQECFFDVADGIKQRLLLKWVFSQGISMDNLFNNTIVVLMEALNKFNCFWNTLRKQSLLKGNWMDENGFVNEDMIDVLLNNAQTNKPSIEVNEDARLQDITKDDNVPQIDEQIENALKSITQKCERDGQWYPENAIKFGKRVQLLINHRNNTVDMLKCNLRLRSTVLYYFTKYPQDFVYFLFKYRNVPIEQENIDLLYADNQ